MEIELAIWTPTITDIQPKGKPFKYVIYSIMALLRIFKNGNYFHFTVKKENTAISSFFVIPSHYRWPFMLTDDVQFTFVITNKAYRGKGIAWQGIYNAAVLLKQKGVRTFWYVTDSDNYPSQRLAEKMGFQLYSAGIIKKKMSGLFKVLVIRNDK